MPEQPRILVVPSFTFRIEPSDVVLYRAALGASGERVPFGMALRALTAAPVQAALRDMLAGKLPIHLSQDCRAEHQLEAGVDYICSVRFLAFGESRLRVEQRLTGPSGQTCLDLSSEITLVCT